MERVSLVPLALPGERASVFGAIGPQPLAVVGFIPRRFLVNYRVPVAAAQRLLPAGLRADPVQGHAMLSVCALRIERMGVRGTPGLLRFRNAECLYRLGVRVTRGGRSLPSFLTLRSDVSAWALSRLGRLFSHYRPRPAQVRVEESEASFHLTCRSRDGLGDAELQVDLGTRGAQEPRSLFEDCQGASAFLLGMGFSVGDRRDGRLQVQDIEHSPWDATFVRPAVARFAFLDHLCERFRLQLTYDSTLFMSNIHQTWGRTRCL